MTMRVSVDLDAVKFGDLYRFVDHARSAGIPADAPITVETQDGIGNDVGAHTLSVDLGDVDELSRPTMIDGRGRLPLRHGAVPSACPGEHERGPRHFARTARQPLRSADRRSEVVAPDGPNLHSHHPQPARSVSASGAGRSLNADDNTSTGVLTCHTRLTCCTLDHLCTTLVSWRSLERTVPTSTVCRGRMRCTPS